MRENKTIHTSFISFSNEIEDIIHNYDIKGEAYGNQNRNSLRLFQLNEKTVNVKSFKIPNLVNQIAYRFFRKSKAQRSFEYAMKLQELEVGTPQPIAFYEYMTSFLFKKSYYMTNQLDCDLTYRELTLDLEYPNHDEILRAFTRFTYCLHEKGIKFLDHSPGNTLIKKISDDYEFYLVDLNRMEFKSLSFEERIENFKRLTIHKSMVEVMSDEYAKCIEKPYQKVFDLMWSETQKFQRKYRARRSLKKKIKFWKS
ncbi:lipopolysaccharide kinase InaA family protein [Winogradskyella vincentii]|uniref:Kdo domain containing protein n=1 Tax=Winogradskyella vincentii TaxID=2877122 RepID=A0ABS7Y3V4_9FLAO|nr:lipopolysaccharide kinase InaA family protein [Winogradskyella vincentii]MCA0153537.1 Kdo domain containing protein [Winogradskyella vincentii]